jgi:hypothetical protein
MFKKTDILQNVTVYKDKARAGKMTDAMENRISDSIRTEDIEVIIKMATKGMTASQTQRSYMKLNQETTITFTLYGTAEKNRVGFYHIMNHPI